MKRIILLGLALAITGCASKTIYIDESEESFYENRPENRFVDKEMLKDIDFFHSVQKRLYDVSEQGYATTTYPYCLAQTHLDKATEQYNNNDRTKYVEENLESSLGILAQMEVYLDDIIYPETKHDNYTVRKDLWNLTYDAKEWLSSYEILDSSKCGQCTLAELELELKNARHLNSELGLRNALSSIRKSEMLASNLSKEIINCKINNLYKFIPRSIYFESDKYNLRDVSFKRLDVIAKLLKENNRYKVNIVGFTDSVGSSKYNQLLSKKRAMKAYNYLISKNISKHRMNVLAKGETNQIKDRFNQNNNAVNRRVDVFIKK